MILPALIAYYDRLDADPEKAIAAPGFSQQKISFCVLLDAEGRLEAVQDMRTTETNARGKVKIVPSQFVVPGQAKPSGQGINPCFLWDNAAYMLGFKPADPKPERTRAAFEAFRDRHLALAEEVNDPAFHAVCAFLKAWDPSSFTPDADMLEQLSSFGVFRVDLRDEKREYVHQRPVVRSWWKTQLGTTPDGDTDLTPSLTDGQPSRIARLHEPAIKGVWGAQSSGARLVSFNEDAFTSYGKSQGANAPISEDDAFKYCTALNALLRDQSRRTGIGDATVVWWSDAPTEVGEDVVSAFFAGQEVEATPKAEDVATSESLRAALDRLTRGLSPERLPDGDVRFHVLGLAPNAARLSVRFWWTGPIADMIEHVRRHHEELALGNWQDERMLSLHQILFATARDADSISPRLSGDVMRAVLGGHPYPEALTQSIARRVRADGIITSVQARILKASIIRKGMKMEAFLDPSYKSAAYQCGRLFAVLDYAQRVASPEVKGGLGHRYLRAVMATPGLLLGRLEGLCEVGHIRKIDVDDVRRFFRDELAAINAALNLPLPTHLLGMDQTIFMLGYYKQLQWMQSVVNRPAGNKPIIHRYRTARGEWVRSKLERRVMDTLTKFGVMYRYEVIRVFGNGIPRQPDLMIPGPTQADDVYIEVAGGWKDMEAYNQRHEQKLREYAEHGIRGGGGDRGTLRVLDFRDVDFRETRYDEVSMVYDKLRDVIERSRPAEVGQEA